MDKLKGVLANLDPKNNSHWTQDGLPKLEIVRLLTGDSKVSRDDILSVAPELTRESALKALEGPVTPPAPIAPPVPGVAPVVQTAEQTQVSLALQATQEASQLSLDLETEGETRAEAEHKLARMLAAQEELKGYIAQQQSIVDSLVVAEEGEREPSHVVNQRALGGYLESCLKRNEARAELIREHGPTRLVKTAPASPLDQSLAIKRK